MMEREKIETVARKCLFCGAEATKVDSFYLGTIPKEGKKVVRWTYLNTAIYLCDDHTISHKRRDMNDNPLDATSF